ncbi:MAG: alkaline phosphatase family protein [Actinomycetota bacterium]|nr:alkaline phosphatase family protein [Actinomycetota bacterium]
MTGPLPGGRSGLAASRPDDLSVPAYGRRSLADLLPSVVAALGVPGYDDVLGLTPALTDVRRVILLLVDGMGQVNLAEHAAIAPTLTSLTSPIGAIDSSSPSTTPVSLASLGTGVPPGEHGIVGFTVAIPGTDRLLTHIDWREDPEPSQWQPAPTVFETAVRSGVSVHASGPGAFLGTGLTEAAYRGAGYRPAVSAGDLVSRSLAAAAEGERSLVYAYHGALDMTGHVRGCTSAAWRYQLAQVDQIAATILTELPADTALVVTADHGMIDVAPSDKIDLDASQGEPGAEQARGLSAGVRLVAGEPRARYVYTQPGAIPDVLATWTAILGKRAWVLSREEAIDSGLFGTSVPTAHAERIGNVLAWARDNHAITASRREPGAHSLIGYHGSLTDAELSIPVRIGRR